MKYAKLIPNSRDIYPDSERKTNGILEDGKELTDLGFDVTVISLKDYFNKKEKLQEVMKAFNAYYALLEEMHLF